MARDLVSVRASAVRRIWQEESYHDTDALMLCLAPVIDDLCDALDQIDREAKAARSGAVLHS